MPLYEYICRACGHAFEVLQRIGERGDDLRCPACDGVGAERQLSTFASRAAQSGTVSASGSACGSGGFT